MRISLTAAAAIVLLSACGTAERESTPSPTAAAQEPTTVAASDLTSPAPLTGADPALIDQEAWWTWAGSELHGQGPVEDATGANCAANQPEDVWFLAGTFGGHADRACDIPADVPIVFPLMNMAGGPDDCDGFLSAAAGAASVGGASVQAHEFPGTTAIIDVVDGNAMFGDGGTFEVTMCGLWVALEPLPAGEHTVAFEGESGGFSVSASYILTVAS